MIHLGNFGLRFGRISCGGLLSELFGFLPTRPRISCGQVRNEIKPDQVMSINTHFFMSLHRKLMLAEHGGRTVRIRPLPIGIPFSRFDQMAHESPNCGLDTNNVKVVLGVDRLDYTKGLVNRLQVCETCSRLLVSNILCLSRHNNSQIRWWEVEMLN